MRQPTAGAVTATEHRGATVLVVVVDGWTSDDVVVVLVVAVCGATLLVVVLVGAPVVLEVDVLEVVSGGCEVVVVVVTPGPSNVAVYVVSTWGVLMVWACAPPSDQESNVFALCGDGASMVRITPTTPTTSAGVAIGWPSSVSSSPGGLVSKCIVAVSGWTSTTASPVRPTESVARRKTRYHTLADVSPSVAVVNCWGEPTRSSTYG